MSLEDSTNSKENNPAVDSQLDMMLMFKQFMKSSQEDRIRNSNEFTELRSAIALISRGSPQISLDSPIPDRANANRRSSIFFGSPLPKERESTTKTQIQVLQADIIYDKELKVSSLEGLQYLAKQLQLFTSKYPGREVRTAHMVAFSLRPHVIASWNSYCFKESQIAGLEVKEIMVEDWLSLSNGQVQEILVESARPRTRELYSRELVLFLGKGIPQTPTINPENFSSTFYAPLMKSLNDLLHLHDLLSEETSNHSNNKSKMPVPGYGTRDSPGQTQLWIISLGNQKEAVLQWLGKDELSKHKTLAPAVKFIRSKLMEGRLNSEARQDFDSKLTPIRYEDIRHMQGESNTRQQTNFSSKPQSKQHNKMPFSRDHRPLDHFSAIHSAAPDSSYRTSCEDDNYFDYNEDGDNTIYDEDNNDFTDDLEYSSIYKTPTNFQHDNELSALENLSPRSAIASTFRGYCSELFVFGSCHRRDSGCTLDHTSSGQEKCIHSFNLLAKRDLTQHGQLPAFSNATTPERSGPFKPSFPTSRQDSRIPKPYVSNQGMRSLKNK